jgi:hypothetical protein
MCIIIVYDGFAFNFKKTKMQAQKFVHAIWKIMSNINLQVLLII